MLYDITLRISYAYGSSGAGGRHVMRLLPAALPGEQRLVAASLDILPRPDERTAWTDFFGNDVVEVAFLEPQQKIAFSVMARIRRSLEMLAFDISPRLGKIGEDIARCRALDAASPHHFLGASPRVTPDAAISDYARAVSEPAMTTMEAVRAVNLALHHDMKFDPEATTVDTAPAEAFARRGGVCQDFTHVMIAALRGIGVPAGYVSGLLRTHPPEGKPRLEGADAMHAWVRAWCGNDAGWVEFDPTNGVIVGNDHIVIARGRDYADVSPVRGALRIAGDHTSEHFVDVNAVEAD